MWDACNVSSSWKATELDTAVDGARSRFNEDVVEKEANVCDANLRIWSWSVSTSIWEQRPRVRRWIDARGATGEQAESFLKKKVDLCCGCAHGQVEGIEQFRLTNCKRAWSLQRPDRNSTVIAASECPLIALDSACARLTLRKIRSLF